jgi:uncharacterized protein YwqG
VEEETEPASPVQGPILQRGDLILADLPPALAPYRDTLLKIAQPAWILECQPVAEVSRFVTHIGGTNPYLPTGRTWPQCEGCGRPLSFLWQVDFTDFGGVGTLVSQGLFQFFYCWFCFPFAGRDHGFVCRWYPGYNRAHAENEPQIACPDLEARHTGPYRVIPHSFLSLPDVFTHTNPVPDEVMSRSIGHGRTTVWSLYRRLLPQRALTQLGGYPTWIQPTDETPSCPVCRSDAVFVGALGTEDSDLLGGDAGYWYFFACMATPACHGMARPFMTSQMQLKSILRLS